jgi:hypothetical protein
MQIQLREGAVARCGEAVPQSATHDGVHPEADHREKS